MLSQYGKLRPTNGQDRLVGLGHPSKFQRGSRLGFVTATTSLDASQPNFAPSLAVCWAGILYTHFRVGGSNGILPGAKFTLRPSIAFSCIGSVTARQSRSWRQPNFAACYNFLQGIELTNFRSSSFSRPGAKAPINEFRQLSWKIHCKWNK